MVIIIFILSSLSYYYCHRKLTFSVSMGFENSSMVLTQIHLLHPLTLFMHVFDAIKIYYWLENPCQIVLGSVCFLTE